MIWFWLVYYALKAWARSFMAKERWWRRKA